MGTDTVTSAAWKRQPLTPALAHADAALTRAVRRMPLGVKLADVECREQHERGRESRLCVV
jgi:hypothetical protein